MKKILLSLGTLASTIAPVAAVVACGNETSDKSPYDLTSKQDASTETQLNFVVKLKNYVSESYIREIKSRIAEDIAAANKDALKYSTIHIEFQDAVDATKKEGLLISTNPLTDANKNDLTAIHTFMDTSFATLITSAKANSDLHKFFVEPTSGGSGSGGSGSTGGSGSDGSGSTGGTGTDGSGGTGTDGSGSGGSDGSHPTVSPQEKRVYGWIVNALDIKEGSDAATTENLFALATRPTVTSTKVTFSIVRTNVVPKGPVTIVNVVDKVNPVSYAAFPGETLTISLPLTNLSKVDFTNATFEVTSTGTSPKEFKCATAQEGLVNILALQMLNEFKVNVPWTFTSLTDPQTKLNKYLVPVLTNALQVDSLDLKFTIDHKFDPINLVIEFTTNITTQFTLPSDAGTVFNPGKMVFTIRTNIDSWDPSNSATPLTYSAGDIGIAQFQYTDSSNIPIDINLDSTADTALKTQITALYKDLSTLS